MKRRNEIAQSVYSYNGSHLHLTIDDNFANAYNKAMDAWFQAQKDFERDHGRKVTSDEVMHGVLQIRASREEGDAWNKVAKFVNNKIKEGLELTEEECTSSYLVKL